MTDTKRYVRDRLAIPDNVILVVFGDVGQYLCMGMQYSFGNAVITVCPDKCLVMEIKWRTEEERGIYHLCFIYFVYYA